MPIDDRTTNRSYQLPNAGNQLVEDVARLRAALSSIDADIFARYTKTEVDTLINNLVQGAPGALDTLNELAAALGDDPNFATTITTQLALKANAAEVYSKGESDARYVQGQTQAEMVFIATANQSVFTLSTPVINKPSALVTVDGVVQPTAEYSLNQTGTQLTLSEGVPVGTIVRVLALGVSSEGAPADDTVTTPKLRDGAVTTPKLGAAAVTASKLASEAVTEPAVATSFIASGGNWSPTITSPVNCSDVSMPNGSYLRVGNVVTFSGRILYTTTGEGAISFGLRIPVNAADGGFQSGNQASGIISGTQGNNPIAGFIIAEASSQRVTFQSTSGAAGSRNVTFVCQYRIVAT